MIAAAALALLAAAAEAASAAPPAPPAVSSAAAIAGIRVSRKNVFDLSVPGENLWPFRIADRIHVITRERVIRRELLFAPGDRWDALKAIESERNLRANYAFRKVEIDRVPRPDGRVDAVVRTQDSWTTNPQLSIGTEGGQSFMSYGLEEGNLLGYGKSVGYTHSRNGTKHTDAYSYGDPRFLGTRLGLDTGFARTQDGDQESVALARPFYSLETPRAVSMAWSNSAAIGTEYRDAAEYSKYLEHRRVVDAAYGLRLNNDRWFVQRLEAGWYEEHAAFTPTGESPGTLPGTLPADRDLSGPTVGYTWVQPRYVKETYIDRMERVEDFNLGNELRVRTGSMGKWSASDRDRWIFNASDRQGLSLGPGRFALASVQVSGRLRRGVWENGLATADLNLFWKNYLWSRERTLVAHVEAAQGRNLDRENQIVLGGNTGLRGYKNDAFVGGRSVLMNLEDRFFFPGEWLHLVRFGGATFVESGSVVPEGSGFSPARFKSDVGAGLRAASTRSASGGVVRLDLAYALDSGPGRSRWVISIRGGQAFSLFNSASGRVNASPASRL